MLVLVNLYNLTIYIRFGIFQEATLILQQGIHPKVVQERLGHTDITVTLNAYSHVLHSMQTEAAEKMDDLLTSPIDVSKELKKLKEQNPFYIASIWDGNGENAG